MSEFILGVKPQWDGLLIDPCIPEAYGTYKIHRRFRQAEYDLTVHYTGKKGGYYIPYKPGKQALEIEL